ncbi:penicillin amidase [Microtetraspora sp. NBRC 13810]|uniref:penicillin acylase family protein n=1 Tax=Microtetraspora sp. NBRC 13810 TaxID=3030990 RepID=UPI0024A48924|nr:penicillin acylase family protein [Microtetraspora sp. NBRC 13810]GLW10645.1 penicillin amidase [Microtetraspora sp. NBRC 13810]
MVRIAPFAGLPRPWRWAARVLTVLLALALVLGVVATVTVRRSFPQVAGEIEVPGLSAPVTVRRDANGIPHIYADTPADLFLAQGYVHAQDRFWEMDFRRKTTAGRLSELFGATTLDVDKVVRTLGWRRTAEQEVARLAPETVAGLESYSAGVNAWLSQHGDAAGRSLEYVVLGLTGVDYTPEPWTPADSVSWLKAMAWDLRSNMDSELSRALSAAKVSPDRVQALFPGYPYDRHLPIVTASTPEAGAPAGTTPGGRGIAGAGVALAGAARAVAAVPSLLGTAGADRAGIGSNSWVVGGAHTATGKPLLANDPHLGPRIPSIWYQAGLHCRTRTAACPYDVTGFTFSGLPGVVIGHNQRIAWGFTNLGPDVTDLYLEHTRDGAYQDGAEWRPVTSRRERIEVAGGAPVELDVRSTGHGPIISGVLADARNAIPGATARPAPSAEAGGDDADGGTEGTAAGTAAAGGAAVTEVALRWTALDPGRTADAIFMLNRAQNFEEFRTAAASFEAPSQNLVYADVDGNIGYQAPGRIPVRASGDGTWPARGWTGEQEWTGFIPFEKLPSVYNPPEGYIVTANNAVTRPGGDVYLTSDWSYGYRSQRITDLVRKAIEEGPVTADTMSRIQLDDANTLAPVLVPYLLRAGVPGEVRDVLGRWDFRQSRDSAGAAVFNATWRHLLGRAFADELTGAAEPGGGDRWYEVVRALLDRPDDPWWDDIRTPAKETRDDMLAAAATAAAAELTEELGDAPEDWRWGDLHTLELTHETFGTSGVGPIEWLFNRGPLRTAGGKDTVNATGWTTSAGYQVDWVPSMRMVVDLADLDRSRWINLTGASGHAFHASYDDQAEPWADGGTLPMRHTEAAVRAAAVDTLTLRP